MIFPGSIQNCIIDLKSMNIFLGIWEHTFLEDIMSENYPAW